VSRIEIEETVLIELLNQKNSKGLEILYDNYSSALFGVIRRIIQEEEIAEDVLQETFIKIWKNFSSFDPSKGRLFTWMVNIGRNCAIDKTRSSTYIHENKNRPLVNIVSDQEEAFEYNPETIDVKKMINQLDPEYSLIINLLYFGGYSQSEVAEKLQIPLGTVKTRARSAIQKLKSYFN
jgi:RNA polymerase sigma-70 factor, ECF subfamily